jgi:hypothetical protein
MHCGHCSADYHPETSKRTIGKDADWVWEAQWESCPRCGKFNIRLANGPATPDNPNQMLFVHGSRTVYPRDGVSRKGAAAAVPPGLAEDYNQACLVLGDSPKASAALGRRALQIILRDHAKVKPQDLSKEIDEVLAAKQLPSHLANDVDAIRHIGNFAAHPIKSTSSGEIVDVEPGEAEWQLDVLVGLFDFYFVGPAESNRKREAFDKKLADAGKPPLKKPTP